MWRELSWHFARFSIDAMYERIAAMAVPTLHFVLSAFPPRPIPGKRACGVR
jgi:hypothetical protein